MQLLRVTAELADWAEVHEYCGEDEAPDPRPSQQRHTGRRTSGDLYGIDHAAMLVLVQLRNSDSRHVWI